ncbi:MAG: preprotein translocase subunit SecG [Christensenellales bacterium]|jgi:preprotein translocase subunit SecG
MQALVTIFNVLLVLNAIGLIVAVLMQQGNTAGLGSVGGGAETFFGKNKAKTIEGKLEKYTKYGVVSFVILAVLVTALSSRLDSTRTPSVSAPVAAEEPAAVDTAETEETTAEEAPAEETAAEETPAEEPNTEG